MNARAPLPPRSHPPRRRRIALAVVLLSGYLAWAQTSAAAPTMDVDLIRGPIGTTGCVQCHESELKAWQQTHHFNSKKVLFGKDGRAVLKKLGLKGLPTNLPLCQTCHVTLYSEGGASKPKVKWGVSCESCHGPSKNWIEVHGKLSPHKTVEEEPAEHRDARLKEAAANGMILPSDIFRLASNCFGCHTVPQEALVDKGGHSAGSAEFELLSWSQGEVRHRFLRGNANADAPAARRRVLYVVGQMADACGSLRALAKATEDGAFAKAMIVRITNAKAALGKIAAALGESAAGAAVKAVDAAVPADQLRHGNAAPLTAAADAVQKQGEAFAAEYLNGDALAGVDPLLPTSLRGKPLR